MSVTGLKLEITSAELKALVEGRMKYHSHKSEVLEGEMKRLGAVLDDLDAEAEQIGKFSNSNNPVDTLKSKAKVHRDRATYFKFFADHVVPNETYLLSTDDLRTIEVLSAY